MNEQRFSDILIEPERYEFFENGAFALEQNRREFFQMVGGGLVVALLIGDLFAAQRSGQGRRGGGQGGGPQEIGAWLHIGEDSAITVYTGKVEMGQNIRTSLTQAVAVELRTSPTRIRLVMADTGLTPFDQGTAGSSTTPRMAPQLRRVAAAARELLLDLAAEQGKIDRAKWYAADGKIVEPESKKSFTFGELTKGKKLMKVIGPQTPTTPADQWAMDGTPKVDGRAFVTGTHKYASDTKRPGMLFGKVLRPPAYKATLASVDTRAAEAMPGVKVVHDGNFVAVVAPTEHAAALALLAIQARWNTTPQPSGDELFQYLKAHPSAGRGGFGGPGGNGRGSIQAGLEAADQKIAAVYTAAYIAHTPMEPRVAVAEWSDGKVTVWTGTQRPFGVQAELAGALGIPSERIRVMVPDMGCGFGGKHTGEAAIEAARLAKAMAKPVKVAWTREEEFTWAYFRPAGLVEVSAGVTKDGTLIAWEFHNYNSGGSALRTPYEVANEKSQFHGADSPLRQGSYRALASTVNNFVRESHMDDLASAIKLDPLAFRLKNLKDARLRAVLEAVAKQFGWGKAKAVPGQGFGIAGGTEKGSYVATCAEVTTDRASGRVKIVRLVTAFECGAIVNPDHLKNQIEGASIMGLGGALFEAIQFANGKILNPHFSSYRVPRFADTPLLETVLLDRKDLPAAGAGETPIVAIAPAIGNAIFNATGIRLRSLPMIPNGLKDPANG
jgi:isoquinoline 1-oxidoreductase